MQSAVALEIRAKRVPGQPALFDSFELSRPRNVSSFEDILGQLGNLFLMTGRDEQFAVRGQMVLLPFVVASGPHDSNPPCKV